jgi:nickel/cobalt exporter
MPAFRFIAIMLFLVLGGLVALGALATARAETGQPMLSSATPASPFGPAPLSVASPGPGADTSQPASGPLTRFGIWVQATQNMLYRQLAQGVRRLREEQGFLAALSLISVSFLYGILHAVGPGHGKAVISSYVLASARTARRGIMIAFASAIVQALSAIALVGVLAVLLNAAGLRIREMVGQLESVSYALVALIGAAMLALAIRNSLRSSRRGHDAGAASVHGGASCGHSHCGHAHLPGPSELDARWSWRGAAATVLAVGIRPCTGAVLVLIFALTQGMIWAGVAATFAMALGTAITVSLFAVLAVSSRILAARLGRGGKWTQRIEVGASYAGALLVLGLGIVLFVVSLGPAPPF